MTPEQDSPDADGQTHTQADFAVGDTVVDREQDDDKVAVVVNCPPVVAKKWEAYQAGGETVTVADDNPEYDPTSRVVVVMFLAELDEWGVEWSGEEPLALADVPTGTAYAFPPNRLEPVGTYLADEKNDSPDEPLQDNDVAEASSTDDDASEPAPDTPVSEATLRDRLDAIAGTVEELNIDDVAVDTFREVVVVEKLGEQYLIDTDGSVNADDPLAERLEDTIAEHVDD